MFLVYWMVFSKEIKFFVGNCKPNKASKVTKFFRTKVSNFMVILIIIAIAIRITLIMDSKKVLSLD